MNKREFQKLQKDIETITNKYQADLTLGYEETLNSIKLEISSIFERHAREGVVSRRHWNKHRSRIEKQIADSINSNTKSQNEAIKESIREVYKETFYRSGFSIAQMAMVGFPIYSLLKDKDVNKAIFNEKDKKRWTDRHRENNRVLSRRLRAVVREGITKGYGYDVMARNLSREMNIGMNKAYRIIQYETGRAYSEAKQESMEVARDKGINTKKRWLSTLDSLTRDSHQNLDGKTIEIDEYFMSDSGAMSKHPRGFGVAREDINCRCDVIEIFEGLEPSVRMARERDRERGKIIPYTTYNEWKNTLE